GGAGGGLQASNGIGGTRPGELAEHDEIGERVAAESVGAVHAGRALAAGEEAGDACFLRVRVHADAAHEVVQRRPDLHRLAGDVHLGELLELVVHTRQTPLDEVGGPARRDVE